MGVHVDETGGQSEAARIARGLAGRGAQVPSNGGDATGMDPDIRGKRWLAGPVVDVGILDEHVGSAQYVAKQDETHEGQQNSASHVVPSCSRWGTLQAADKKHQLFRHSPENREMLRGEYRTMVEGWDKGI